MSSALTKVPDGAWFTITLAGLLACLLILWRFGKEQQWAAEAEDRFPTTHLVEKDPEGGLKLTSRYGGDPLSIIKGFGKNTLDPSHPPQRYGLSVCLKWNLVLIEFLQLSTLIKLGK